MIQCNAFIETPRHTCESAKVTQRLKVIHVHHDTSFMTLWSADSATDWTALVFNVPFGYHAYDTIEYLFVFVGHQYQIALVYVCY